MTRILPALLDAVLVLVFAAIGRRSHAEGLTVGGVLETAWPFLAGAAGGWVLATLVLDDGPRSFAFGGVVVVAWWLWSSSSSWADCDGCSLYGKG